MIGASKKELFELSKDTHIYTHKGLVSNNTNLVTWGLVYFRHLVNSGTSLNGLSEIGTTSLQWTNSKAPIDSI